MRDLKTSPEIGGMGHSVKRKEDARFIRGKGKYTDDVVLPGMLHMDIVRSPYAYAKIKSTRIFVELVVLFLIYIFSFSILECIV